MPSNWIWREYIFAPIRNRLAEENKTIPVPRLKAFSLNKTQAGTSQSRTSEAIVSLPFRIIVIITILSICNNGFGQMQDTFISSRAIKKLSLQQLMNLKVTSVSKIPQKLTEVASAIQVITGQDIRRSTATSLPEVLRLAPNLQVARTNSHDWAITARGFNAAPLSSGSLADKLLVMIDGRSVYTPLFGGVFWDAQNALLEDIDRVEVVSGPGGTLWGDNAVNGVINVISKPADETQGLYASAAMGSFLQDQAAARFGGKAGKNIFYRVYGDFFDYNSTRIHDTINANDNWNMAHGGFRIDYYASKTNTITLLGDVSRESENTPTSTIVNGQNLMGRWTHKFSEASEFKLQVYFDRAFRNFPIDGFCDELKTYDMDFQNSFLLGKRQQILWGGGFRLADDHAKNSPALSFTPANATLLLGTGFVQDQITLLKNRLQLTIGTKLSSNHYTSFEVQPSGRLAFTPDTHNTIWAAVSRAVRVPGRFDVDELTPDITTPGRKFKSEKVLAYELGYRVEPFKRMAVSVASFYNKYTDLRSVNANLHPPPALMFANDQKANTWGVEVTANYWMFDWWYLRTGYTYVAKKFKALSPLVYPGADVFEALDPHHQAIVQSNVDLQKNLQLDITGRFVDSLTIWPLKPAVSAYFCMDVRIAWQYKKFEFSLCGRNILAARHVEFGAYQIPRGIHGKLTCRI